MLQVVAQARLYIHVYNKLCIAIEVLTDKATANALQNWKNCREQVVGIVPTHIAKQWVHNGAEEAPNTQADPKVDLEVAGTVFWIFSDLIDQETIRNRVLYSQVKRIHRHQDRQQFDLYATWLEEDIH